MEFYAIEEFNLGFDLCRMYDFDMNGTMNFEGGSDRPFLVYSFSCICKCLSVLLLDDEINIGRLGYI